MWSKRRKKFRRYYDPQKHVWYLIRTRYQMRLAEVFAAALDDAILYGIDAIADHHKKEIGSVCSALFARTDLN